MGKISRMLMIAVLLLPPLQQQAHAQILGSSGNAPAPAPAPAAAPANPAPAAGAAAPRVNLCRASDINTGRWKLKRVFETPPGAWTEDLRRHPHQYRKFLPDSVYQETKGSREYQRAQGLDKAFADAQAAVGVQQYVVNEQGIVYLYRDGKAVNSFHCGIVQENRPPYLKGEMVLTPTQASSAKIFLLYKRPYARPQPQPATQNPWNPNRLDGIPPPPGR